MPYENYTIEDFLTDGEFKKWVINPDTNTQLFWKKWIDGHPDQKPTIMKARELILSYQFKEPETISEEEKEAILERVLTGQVKHKYNQHRLRYRVAAALLLLFITSFFTFYHFHRPSAPTVSMVVKENPPGQKSTIALPDGTKVWLNSGSRITFPEKFSHKRTVQLQGEAYFEVVENAEKPFEVISNGVITTALGTSFNVKAYDRQPEVEVLLVTGKVSVERGMKKTGNRNKIVISRGEKVIYNTLDHTMDKVRYEDNQEILWKDGIISFRKAGYREIEERLERWYGVEIEAQGLNRRRLRYTADFDNENLERVLERMGFTEKFTFEISENKVKINFE